MKQPDVSSCEIRPAVFSDCETLVGIDARCFPAGIAYDGEEIAALLRAPNALTVVAEQTHAVAGFASAHYRKRTRGGRVEIHGELITIDVLPEARRSHVGSRLYARLEAWLRTRQAVVLELHVAVANDSALGLYHRHGFQAIERVPRYYPESMDAWRMSKSLL